MATAFAMIWTTTPWTLPANQAVALHPDLDYVLVQAGGEYVQVGLDEAYVDGNLVTAPAWPAHPEWMRKFLEVLGSTIEA